MPLLYRESTMELDRDTWGQEREVGLGEEVEPTTRQEDTELGIFRPDEL